MRTDLCAPSRSGNFSKTQSCLTIYEMRSVAALYNQDNASDPIPKSDFTNVDLLRDALDKRFTSCKGKELCWLEQPAIKQSRDLYLRLQRNFKPKKPESWKRNKRQWLNTYDILDVMKQYSEAHTEFEFMGVFPVDFQAKVGQSQCVVQSMCNFSVEQLIDNGKSSFGIVFNLDKHNQPGSHWVACFCSLDPKDSKFGICYFDSVGKKPPREIFDFMKSVKEQCKLIFKQHMSKFVAKFNCTQKQFKNTECGVFSMVFIKFCLENKQKSYRQVRKMIGKDDDIFQFRETLYASLDHELTK